MKPFQKLRAGTLALLIPLTACGHLTLDARKDLAVEVARGAGLAAETIPAGRFELMSYARYTQPGAPVRVYIEGDGLAWVSRHEKSLDPTPTDPTALRLAAADGAPNVVWLARPCQYVRTDACDETYWTTARTAPEVLAAYQAALDRISAAHGAGAFELVGYSGGAAVALLTAAARHDVASIRTVAGNTDYAAFDAAHGLDVAETSLKPESAAARLSTVPQIHFIGGDDKVIPPAVFAAWKQASRASTCLRAETVPGNTHDKGWASSWPGLLQEKPECGGASN
jgi:dienelactone hydrolase